MLLYHSDFIEICEYHVNIRYILLVS